MDVIGNGARYRARSELHFPFSVTLKACPDLSAFADVIQLLLLNYFSVDTENLCSLNILYTPNFAL